MPSLLFDCIKWKLFVGLLVNSPIAIGELASSKVGNDIFRCDCPFIGHKLQNNDHSLCQGRLYRLLHPLQF
jgi:hypothetical protein